MAARMKRDAKRLLLALVCGSVLVAGCAVNAPRSELVGVESMGNGRFILHGPDEGSVQARAASVCPGAYQVTRFFHGSSADPHPRKHLSQTRFPSVDYRTAVQHEIVCSDRS